MSTPLKLVVRRQFSQPTIPGFQHTGFVTYSFTADPSSGGSQPIVLGSFFDSEVKQFCNSMTIAQVSSVGWSGNPTTTFSTSTGITISDALPGAFLVTATSGAKITVGLTFDRTGHTGTYGFPYNTPGKWVLTAPFQPTTPQYLDVSSSVVSLT